MATLELHLLDDGSRLSPAPLPDLHLRRETILVLREQLLAQPATRQPPQLGDAALFRLAELERAAGDLDTARARYAQFLERQPEHRRARLLHAILACQPEPSTPQGGPPYPFLLTLDVLDAAARAALWRLLEAQRPRLRPARVYEGDAPGREDPVRRRALHMTACPETRQWLLPRVVELIARHDLTRRFGLPPLGLERVQMEAASSGEGDHFEPHQDNAGRHRERALTFVYYLFREPRPFQGGDLLLRDDLEDPALGYTRYQPVSNSLILFPSRAFHQVLPVTCDRRDPLDGRLTLHGWFPSQSS